jgi:hypothetical protein
MLINRIFIISLLLFNTLYHNISDNSIFISPVKIPLLLSANFGELRIDHYHSGLDIKTEGETGKEIVASADGYIYRIGISPGGFGKALYIRHPSGYSTVYGHLDRFIPEIDEWVKSQQYEKKSFLVTLYPMRDQFPVKQGDLIAYSGNSGSSGGPHLHYEIRKSESEIPVNPLLFEYGIKDNILPVIERLIIYPVGKNTLINNTHIIKKLDVQGSNGNYRLSGENIIIISGQAGFGIKAFDQLNDTYNKLAVYSIELDVDSIPVFKYVMDDFSFNESRYINSHIDYETYMRDNVYYERMFVLPNDKLSSYKDVINRGIYNFSDSLLHNVSVIVTDCNKNKSTLTFRVQSRYGNPPHNASERNSELKVMPYNRTNKFVAENISLSIPSGALYDTLFFSFKRNQGNSMMLSDVYQVHNIFTPLHRAYTLAIKPSIIPAGKESKMTIIQLSDDLKKNAINSTWKDGYLSGESMSFGNFFVGIDTIGPLISANGLISGPDLTGKKDLRIKITDDLTGIKSYEPTIDGNWALFDFDQKNNVIIYRFDDKRITKGTKHKLSLKVTDNKDNISLYNCEFTW